MFINVSAMEELGFHVRVTSAGAEVKNLRDVKIRIDHMNARPFPREFVEELHKRIKDPLDADRLVDYIHERVHTMQIVDAINESSKSEREI